MQQELYGCSVSFLATAELFCLVIIIDINEAASAAVAAAAISALRLKNVTPFVIYLWQVSPDSSTFWQKHIPEEI